jgi:cytochrome c-type biogenesis protein CcmH/NrfG
MLKLARRKKAVRRPRKRTVRGSAEIRQGIDLAKVLAVGVVVLVMVLAVGNYAIGMMQQTGVGNSTIYTQGQNMLQSIATGFGNVVNIALLAIVIIVLGVIILAIERW